MSAPRSATILARLEGHGVRLDLGPFRRLLAALGQPQLAAPAAIVAGTNGKGSVVALLDAALGAAGYRCATATSPHLVAPHERIRIAGADLAEPALAEALDRVLSAAPAGEPPTYFEALVAAGFLAGAAAGVDLFLLEVGMGGRLDATNAAAPVVSTVTRIGFDHTAELGSTLARIAAEKAGVLRAGRAAVIAPQAPEADAALAHAATAVGARLRRVAASVEVAAAEFRGLAGHALELVTARARYRFDLALAGVHQVDNAATALAAAEELAAAGFERLDAGAIARGFAAARWPCRLEALAAGDRRTTVLLDAAHNPDGCAALAAFLDRLERPFTLLFGALADKDLGGMLPPLAARAARVVLTRPDSPRAAEPEALLATLGGARAAVQVEPDLVRALALASGAAGPGLVVACGSLDPVGRLRARLLADGARAVAG